MTVVMVIYLSQTTPIGFEHYIDHWRQCSQGHISQSDNTSKRQLYMKYRYKASYASFKEVVLTNSMEGNNDEMWFLDDDYVVEDEMGEAEEQLVDEGEHNIPFNVADIPQQLVTADAHTQREASGVKGMQMSMLKLMHDNKQGMAAVGLLRQWHQIMMDGWMMVLGTSMDKQLWVVMVLNKYFEEGYGENREEEVPVLEMKTMALSMEHQYMMIMFIAQVLNSMQHKDIHCMVEYPEPLTLESIKALTEVLGRFDKWHWNIKLRLNDMKAFHGHFMNSWVEWVRKAPASWKQDGFLMENMPVGVCLQYGQNQLIMVSQAVEEERMNWSRDHDFRWHKVSLERITWNHGEVYDKPEHDASRVAVDLREIDLLDNDGYEINVYNKAGWDEVHGEMTNEVEFWVYPLAFTWKYGNMKAHGIIPNMAACVGKLNELIFRGGMEDDDMEVDEGGEERVGLARQNPVIHGIASQIYNSLSHWVRNEAKFHSVQLGMMTSALAGAGIETVGGWHWWEKWMEFCNGGFPHERYSQKIQEELWNGWSIYEEIICPLLKAWSHLQVLGPIKDSLKLFKADVMVRQHEWPVEAETQWPMMSSKQAQQLTYGEAHYKHTRWMMWGDAIIEIAQSARKATWAGQSHLTQDEYGHSLGAFFLADAYEAKFTIKLAIENLLPNAYSHISDASFRQACYAVDMAFRVYFDAVKKLVREGVTAGTMAHLCSEDQLTQQSAWERLTALGHWMDERYPLSYMPGILLNLLQKLTSFIADIMIKQCSKDMAHNIPPFIKGGNFIHPSNVVVHEVWLNLGGQAPPAMGSQSMNIPAQWSNSAMAYQASQAIQVGDAHGEWTVAEHLLAEESNVSIVEGAIWRIFGEAGLGGMRAEGEQAAWTIHHDGVRIYHLPDFAAVKGINTFLLAHLGLASIETASGFWSAKWMVDIKPCGGDKIIMQHVEAV
ncbi:hypothetical protein EDC04DRAFT_2606258 [Pisolithus marmoratus]|nr:hypothetical protein EDC04DRAFT_2606258 [Pisolithus marmoratus]